MPEPIDTLDEDGEQNIFEDVEVEEAENDVLLNKESPSFICLGQPEISRSSIFFDRYYYFPEIDDPNLEFALWGPDPITEYDHFGIIKYKELCKIEGIIPFRTVLSSLISETMDLRYFSLQESEMKTIFYVLGYNLKITKVLLEENFFTPKSAEYLAAALKENITISTLNLKHCRIGIGGAAAFGDIFKINGSIEDLDLSFNALGDDGFLHIADGIRFNTSIKKLNLSHNQLGNEAFTAFRGIMEDNVTITDLDLSWNFLYKPKGMKELMEGLSQNVMLQTLNLAWNGIGYKDTIRSIYKYLKSDYGMKLVYLDLSNNRFTGATIKLLYNGMKLNKTIKCLKIRNNPLTPIEIEDFSRLLIMSNSVLREIDFGDSWVQKTFIPISTRIHRLNKTVIVGGIFSDYKIIGPDIQEVLLKRAKYVGLKPKKKKLRKDYGVWLLGLKEKEIDADKFKNFVKKSKIKLDQGLIKLMGEKFGKHNILSIDKMKEVYLRLYPDTKPPEPKRKRRGKKAKKENKGKKK